LKVKGKSGKTHKPIVGDFMPHITVDMLAVAMDQGFPPKPFQKARRSRRHKSAQRFFAKRLQKLNIGNSMFTE